MRFAAAGFMLALCLWTIGCEDIGWDPYAAQPPDGTGSAPRVESPEAPEGVPEPGMSLQLSPDGPGGFVNNPENSRGTLKIIFPSRYTGMITRVVAQAEDGEFRETLERVLPNESGDRERYYGSKPIDSYPDDLIVTANLLNGSSIYYVIENPQARVD